VHAVAAPGAALDSLPPRLDGERFADRNGASVAERERRSGRLVLVEHVAHRAHHLVEHRSGHTPVKKARGTLMPIVSRCERGPHHAMLIYRLRPSQIQPSTHRVHNPPTVAARKNRQVRVVAGEARGRRLVAPVGTETRPTSDRVREAVFSSLESLRALEGARVLDLFAGTGALGIEALSRGAAHATFVERDQRALAAIRTNLVGTDLAARATVVRAEAVRWLEDPAAARADLAFVDPPYAFDGWPGVLDRLATRLAVLESGHDLTLPEGWQLVRQKRYGTTVVTIASRPDREGDA
jgi:16S rRNA (guanine966-N2)-methyltransferase